MGETIEEDVEEIKTSLNKLHLLLEKVSIVQIADHEMTLLHDKNLAIMGLTLNGISSLQAQDHVMTIEHDKIIIRGNGVPSLQETVRSLSLVVTSFIDDVKAERVRRNEQDAEDKKRKREEASKWKWTFIAFGFTVIPAFVWQAVVYWINIAPIIESYNLTH